MIYNFFVLGVKSGLTIQRGYIYMVSDTRKENLNKPINTPSRRFFLERREEK
jgi:hypothetical protein